MKYLNRSYDGKVASDLVIVQSDVKTIQSDLIGIIGSDLTVILSNLVADVQSDLNVVLSNLVADIQSDVNSLASDIIATTNSDIVVIQSNLTVAKSDIVTVLSNITSFRSDIIATTDSDIVVLQSDLTKTRSDMLITHSDVKVVISDLTITKSDLAALMNATNRFALKSITYNGSVSYAAFTVTGCVAVKCIGYVTTALTNHADATSVGTATSVAGLVAATAGTAMQTVGQVWVDNAPSKFEVFPSGYSVIGNGEDIAVVGTANLAAGVVSLYLFYIPLSADGAVVAV